MFEHIFEDRECGEEEFMDSEVATVGGVSSTQYSVSVGPVEHLV